MVKIQETGNWGRAGVKMMGYVIAALLDVSSPGHLDGDPQQTQAWWDMRAEILCKSLDVGKFIGPCVYDLVGCAVSAPAGPGDAQKSFLLGLGLRHVAQKRNGFLVSDVKIEWLRMS